MARRDMVWSEDELAKWDALTRRGPVHGPFPNGTLFRHCRVCGAEFVPTRAGARGPWPIECSDSCRRVWRAWNTQRWNLGEYPVLVTCAWCFQSVSDSTERRNASRYCSRACFLAVSRHLSSNPELDRCEVPKCPDCGLVGCVSRKTRRPDRSSTKRPRGRCRECHRRHLREYELNRPIAPVRDRKRWRARVIAAGDKISPAEVIQRFGNVCYLCDREIDVMIDDPNDPGYLNIDHIIPIRRGGQHRWDNVAPTHRKCNMSKGAKLVAPPVGWKGTWTR